MRNRRGIIRKLTLRRALAELADQGVAAGFAAVFFAAAFFSRGDEYDSWLYVASFSCAGIASLGAVIVAIVRVLRGDSRESEPLD